MKNISLMLGIAVLGVCISARAENANSDMISTKSCSITFAALDVAVDSDKSDLVTATISKGKCKGAKLYGELTHVQSNPKQYQLVFTSMKFNQNSKSISIAAYGVDSETARTALTSKVNDDYFDRNAKILSASFLQGKSEAYNAIKSSKVKISSGTNIGVLFVSKIDS